MRDDWIDTTSGVLSALVAGVLWLVFVLLCMGWLPLLIWADQLEKQGHANTWQGTVGAGWACAFVGAMLFRAAGRR